MPGLRIGWIVTTEDVAEEIWARHEYGMDRHLRFSFGLTEDHLRQGLERITQLIHALR